MPSRKGIISPRMRRQGSLRFSSNFISFSLPTRNILKEKQPSLQFAEADDMGELAVFLCGQNAKQITGFLFFL